MEITERDNSSTVIRLILLGVLLLCIFAAVYAERSARTRNNNFVNTTSPTQYTNNIYKINLNYPSHWKPTPGYNYDHYDGEDGFFSIEAIGEASASIDVLARSEAAGLITEKSTVNGQEARIIDGKELIVKYPKPVTIGQDTRGYFVLKADRAHFKEILATLSFVK